MTGNAGFEFQVDAASPMHYSSLSLSKPWESYRLRVLSSPMATIQSGSVTSLPYINNVSPSSCESIQLYPNSQSTVSLPAAALSSPSDLKATSDIKVSITYNILVPYLFTYKAHHFSRENTLVR